MTPTIFEELDLPESPETVLIADDELLVAQGIMTVLQSIAVSYTHLTLPTICSV